MPKHKKIRHLNLKHTLLKSCEIGPVCPQQRRQQAFKIRVNAALFEKNLPQPEHLCKGDEFLYPNKIGNYSKALAHNKLGEVYHDAYHDMIKALQTGCSDKLDTIPLGGTVRLTNPQAAYAFDLIGPDSHHLAIPPAPPFSSAWNASEMAELYWQALTRDVPFSDYGTNKLTRAAAADLSTFSAFRGPRINGVVTPSTLYRIDVPGDLKGPYISQFLWKDMPFGAAAFIQRYLSPIPGKNFMTDYEEWLNVQNGQPPSAILQFDPLPRYIRNGRDMGEYVHRDFPYQSSLTAGLILLGMGQEVLAPSNPYLANPTQVGFATFGGPHILDFAAKVARVALEAAWFQKWLVHRRLRPEAFGGNVQNFLTGKAKYPINPELLNSPVLCEVFDQYGTYLLPQAFPEGSPTHPAYPSGHATFVGAGITILKAFFNEDYILPDPVVATPDGLSLLPYFGPPLTIGGELNKLAVNIVMGRNFAGIHWRTDATEGMRLGETVAIRILQDFQNTYNEDFCGFSFTKFDGSKVVIK